uniref:EGF-like domain-containing protein n=1 Tax=Biomphalaria glabrata TaxID=6526 RepID=A0A2C9KBE5_BIOGL
MYKNETANSFQQTLQAFLDVYLYWTYFKAFVVHNTTEQGLKTADIFYDIAIVYGKQYLDYYMSVFIYNHFITGTRKISLNETELEILTFKLFDSPEEARLGINPKINHVCQYFGICQSDKRCLNSEFLPVCQEICDYGMYAENEHCEVCDQGQTTLIRGANSRYHCIGNCTVTEGNQFQLDKQTCEPCPSDMYLSEADKMCHVCPYTSYNSSDCMWGGVRTVNNPLLNIELNITIVTPKCLRDDPQYYNNIDEKELLRLMISQNQYSRFCSEYINCGNVITSYVDNQICVPDVSCTFNETCTQFYTRIHIAVYHIRTSGSDIFFNIVIAYGKQFFDNYLSQFIYDHFISGTRKISINGTELQFITFKLFDNSEDARMGINPKINKICQYFGVCSSDKRCLNSEFLPVCQEICDYGMYAENEHCEVCDQGKTTLIRGANSHHFCIDNCTDNQSYWFRMDKVTCDACPQDMYWSDADNTCHVCPYTSYNSSYCFGGDRRNVNNSLLNIELNVTIVTPKCLRDDPVYFNNIDEKQLVQLMMSQNVYTKFCSQYVNCGNVITNYVDNQICVPDASCSLNETCTQFYTRIHIGVYHVRAYISSSSPYNGYDQSSMDSLMRTLYDTTKLYQWIPFINYSAIRLDQPIEIDVKALDDVSKQILYINQFSQGYNFNPYGIQEVFNSIFKKMPEFIGAFLYTTARYYDSYYSDYTYVSEYEIWFRKDVDDELIRNFAETIVMAHEKLGGNLTGTYSIKRIVFYLMFHLLCLAVSCSNGGNFIISDRSKMDFECVEACGNWNWGENCTEACNCTQSNTVNCEKLNGSCICQSNFEGSLCDQPIDPCLKYFPCGEHSDCINTVGHYECQCHEGYKNNPYNSSICEACSGWTYGFNCNTSCSCLIDNTQSCVIVNGNCTCKPGFESINCELDVNECNQSSSPCAGNLQCYNTDGSFLCIEQLIYARVTLNTSDLRLYENEIVHNFQQTLQTYLDQFSYVTYIKVIVKHTVTIQSISTSDVFYDLIIVYGRQSFDYYLSLFIYDHFISGTRKISINGTELELTTFQLFASSEEARLGINPKINQMCQYFGICPSDSRCLNSEFLPICQEICDYGMFAEEEHCMVCKHGQTTLIRGANSQYLCIDNCTENQGYYFLFDKLTCTSCPQDMYRSDVDNTCHVCPYTSYNSSHCIEGGMRTVNNPLLNIELNITIVTPKCLRDDPLYFNNIDEKRLVQLMILQNGYSRFCSPYINCGNVITSYVDNQICIPDASCTLNKTCTQYYSRIHIGVYHIGTYMSSTSATNNHDQSSVEILMRTLYDTTKLYQWIPLLSYQAIRLEQPFNIKVTPIGDVSQQVLYITNIWSSNLSSNWTNQQQTYNTIFQSIPEFINIFALSTYGSSYDTIISNYEIWLRKDVDDLLIESIAKIMVLSHEKLGGNLTGPLLLYKTQQDRADGKMAITWKDVINSISVGQYFCNGGNFILSDRGNGTYDCIETCGDWTWGENCTVPCNCMKNNTVVCERQRGACNCTPDFDGSSCERQIDRCLLYSPCDQHADCINTLKHYECRCHTGFKNNLSNPDICEGECQIPGQGRSWLAQTCQPCGQNEYNDGTRNYCVYCPYTESMVMDTCYGSNYKTIKNVDLEVTFDYQSNFCQFTDEMATKGGKLLTANLLSNFPNSGLCLNLINCDNMIFQINKSDLCKLGKTCSQSANCTDFITRATVYFYNVPEFVSTSSNELRQSIEVFVESLSNLTQLNTNLTDKMKVAVKLPPVNSSVSVIPDNENRLAFIKASVNYQLEYPDLYSFLYTNSLKELGQIVSTYLYPKIEDISTTSSSLTTFTASFMFKEAVNDNAINAIAEAIITSHEQFGGKFGDSIYSFTGSVAVFRSKSDKDKEVSGIFKLFKVDTLMISESCIVCMTSTTFGVDAEDPLKAQRALYPYGPTSGDNDLSVHQDMWWWWWWGISSDPIYFPSGVPFGDRKVKIVTVQANGVIRFGKGYDSWWPYLYYDPDYQEGLLAPFWFYYDYYNRNNGKTYYQLYETSVVGKNHAVIQRATSEITEFFQLSKFKVTYVLVATWVNVEPYKWYSWICQYYQWYGGEWWFQYWYKVYYDMYCYKTEKETNTFQAVYATDGETGYVTVTYKKGDMSWQYDYWMPIVVGYANSEKIRDFGVTYTDLTTKMDVLTWNTGHYGTWMEQVGKIENTDSKCLRFYQENQYLINNYSFKKNMNQLYKCPCSLDRLGAQWWGYSWNFYGFTNTYIYCVAIGQTAKNRLLSGNPLNKLCCYRYTYPTNWWDWYAWDLAWRSAPYVDHRDPDGSHLLLNDPWWWWYGNDGRKSKEEDFNPHKWCCVDSSCPSQFCNLFNKVRPDLGCSLYAEFISGSALGDPHIITLDGTGYTMNGLGEFILLFINELNFTLQARTKQALSAAGNATKATVFSAFAAKEGDTATFQVELSADSKGMIINSCGADLTTDFYADERYNGSNVVADVQVSRKEKNNKTIAVAAFPSSISIEIYNADGYLEFSVNVPKDLKGKTLGLLGNYNDDPNDDFVLPNGTSLSNTSTEREIYEQFAKKWGVTSSNSVFKYKEGENATTYQFPKFEPLFLEEVNETIRKNAEEKCQNNIACVFDYVATGNEDFAASTLAASSQAASVKDDQMNSLPVLSLTSSLNDENRLQVYEGKEVTIHFAATDVDNDVITYQLVGNVSASFSINNQTGDVTYSPNSLDSVLIGYVYCKDNEFCMKFLAND